MNRAHRILSAVIPEEYAGKRLDQVLVLMFPEFSRSQIQAWIRQGHILVNAANPRQRDKVSGGERIEVRVPEAAESSWLAQAIPLSIVYEDEAILVINKPAGMVVHPGAGNRDGTLLNALVNYAPALRTITRAGIVHRLDKDTSGLLVVAKTDTARRHLTQQLQDRILKREYLAIVHGVMIAGGTVEAPVGRHPHVRTRMAVSSRGKPAVSHYRVVKKYRAHTLLRVMLASGRTHQIRVHMTHLHHPLVGDSVYGRRQAPPRGASERLKQGLHGFRRQALHAAKLGLTHPVSGKVMEWTAELPQDMKELVDLLSADANNDHTRSS